MAGNTINMYGGSYVDVHDNEVVNLNIEKAEVRMDDGRCGEQSWCADGEREIYGDYAESCGCGFLYKGRVAVPVEGEGGSCLFRVVGE